MVDNKNLEENLSQEKNELKDNIEVNEDIIEDNIENVSLNQSDEISNEEKEEEYYFTAADLRKQKKRQEQRLKRVAKEEKYRKRNVGRMYRSSAVIAVFAGIMQIIMGLPKEDGMTNIMLGATFICCGYLFYSMGAKADKDKKKQEENR